MAGRDHEETDTVSVGDTYLAKKTFYAVEYELLL